MCTQIFHIMKNTQIIIACGIKIIFLALLFKTFLSLSLGCLFSLILFDKSAITLIWVKYKQFLCRHFHIYTYTHSKHSSSTLLSNFFSWNFRINPPIQNAHFSLTLWVLQLERIQNQRKWMRQNYEENFHFLLLVVGNDNFKQFFIYEKASSIE